MGFHYMIMSYRLLILVAVIQVEGSNVSAGACYAGGGVSN